MQALQELLVSAPGGERVPLAQIGRIVQRDGPAQVSRENGMRRVVVEANVRGRDLGGFVSEVQESLRDIEASLPPGYFVRYGGQFENQQWIGRSLRSTVLMQRKARSTWTRRL